MHFDYFLSKACFFAVIYLNFQIDYLDMVSKNFKLACRSKTLKMLVSWPNKIEILQKSKCIPLVHFTILPQKHGSLALFIKVFKSVHLNRPSTPEHLSYASLHFIK